MIPVLDWSRFSVAHDKGGFVRELGDACRDTGFFLISSHGIPQLLIDSMFRMGDAFFDLPESEKEKFDLRLSGDNRGWTAHGSENLDDSKPDQIDRKEAFNIGLELAPDDPRMGQPFRGPNKWPEIEGFKETALEFFDRVHKLGIDLHRPLALDLGLPEDYFAPFLDEPLATLRMLRYPAGDPKKDGIGAGAHTDYGSITLLMTDGEPGLQVKPRGKDWIDVPNVPGAFVINIADCLMRWTNDIYVSTPHRVQVPKNPRRSLAFFLDPNPDAVISALPGTGEAKYPPVTGEEYLRMRLDATYSEKVTA
ncbi:MAG: isopenicillin N synthase family oxygenase [Boseongicola sp.]|nr:isopenicillin N synthase family oxygenase [Boseongicola sp.]